MDAEVPKCIKKLLSNILTFLNSSIAVKVTGKGVNRFGGYRLAKFTTYCDLAPLKVFERIKRHMSRELRDYEE